MITRRQFLQGAAIGAAGLALPVRWGLGGSSLPGAAGVAGAAGATPLTPFLDALPIPGIIDLRGGGSWSLGFGNQVHRFHQSLDEVPTFGYAGASYLGPTFVAAPGVPVALTWTNDLGDHPLATSIDPALHGTEAADATAPRAAVHLHGGNVESDDDGGPTETFVPGQSRTYHYPNEQAAATLWYHDHALGITRLNVHAGLAGLYLLRDEQEDASLGLPSGDFELPLVVQDRILGPDGRLVYGDGPWMPEFFGDVAVVNGKAWPHLDVARGRYRFRVVNGSNARVYDFRLSNGGAFVQIGTDGGLLAAPVVVSRLVLAPGERADVLVDFSGHRAGDTVLMTNNAPAPFPDAKRSAHHGGVPLKTILQFRVTSATGDRRPVPAVLRPPIVPLPAPAQVRTMSLVELMDEAGEPVVSLLNGRRFHEPIVDQPRVDTVERWDIVNTTGDAHPIHLHLVQFRILQRQRFDLEAYEEAAEGEDDGAGGGAVLDPTPFLRGRPFPPAANEAGWKDTARADPGEVLSLLVPFGAGAGAGVPATASYTGKYVWHCHILEHEDNEMMLPYEVIA